VGEREEGSDARDCERTFFQHQPAGQRNQRRRMMVAQSRVRVVDEETFDCADAAQHRRTHHWAFQRKIKSDQEGKGRDCNCLQRR
jgi:hypothetical protein